MYRIEIKKKAHKTLLKIPADQRKLITCKVREYAKKPSIGRNTIKLSGREAYRMRVGDWRVIFEKDDAILLILVLEVGSRGGIYQ